LRVRVSPPEVSSSFSLVSHGRSNTSPFHFRVVVRAACAIWLQRSVERHHVRAICVAVELLCEQRVALVGCVLLAHHHGDGLPPATAHELLGARTGGGEHGGGEWRRSSKRTQVSPVRRRAASQMTQKLFGRRHSPVAPTKRGASLWGRRRVDSVMECTLSLGWREYTGVMPESGLRELKKARTRRLIADAAARLFAESGYEQVAVTDVAREAEVAEQTVYNYFPTKEQLVIDRDELVRDRLCDLIRSRPSSMTPAAAVRDFMLESAEHIRGIPRKQWRGELGYLAAISPTVHRLALDMIERQATAIADAILDSAEVAPVIARLQGMALAAVLQTIISEAGERTCKGHSQAKIADELYPIIGEMIDELDRWFQVSDSSTRSRPDGRRHRR
jgi:AcrR family transcriptional regulator